MSILCLDAKTTLLVVSATAVLLVSTVTLAVDHVTATRQEQRSKCATLSQDSVSVR